MIRVNNGSLDLKRGFDLVPVRLMSGVTSITLPNTRLFAALAFAATNVEMSFMFGLLPLRLLNIICHFNELGTKIKWQPLYNSSEVIRSVDFFLDNL